MTHPLPLRWPHDTAHVEGRTVILPESWMMYGRIIGAARNYSAIHVDGKKGYLRGGKNPERAHMEGVQGELAFHWWLNGGGFTPTLDGYRDVPDLVVGGRNIEIRTRVREAGKKHDLDLKIQPNDPNDALGVLVIFDQSREDVYPAGHFTVVGWIGVEEAKTFDPVDHGGYGKPAHFIQHKYLKDPEGLRELV